jgi:hypothetical protein
LCVGLVPSGRDDGSESCEPSAERGEGVQVVVGLVRDADEIGAE